MDTSEDIEELLHCDESRDDEPDAVPAPTDKQCSTCLRNCDTVEEKDKHEDTSDRGTKRVDFGGIAGLEINMDYPDMEQGWHHPEILNLFLKEGSLKRVLLKDKLTDGRALNGITHDVLYQTLCFMVDWALVSGTEMIDKSKYNYDPTPYRAKCVTCIADATWKCSKCNKGSELCKCKCKCGKECKSPKKPVTHKVRFSPVVAWACVKCDRADYACECPEPYVTNAKTYHHEHYFSWVQWRSHMEKTTFSSKETVKAALLGNQKAWLAIACSLHHFQDTRDKSMRWMIGTENHLGVKGRWQWTPFQVSISILLQAIDMILMILAMPSSKIQLTPGVMPYLALTCLMIQIKADHDCHLGSLTSRIEAAMPKEMDRSVYKTIYRRVWGRAFQFVIPGHTIKVDTSSMRWMKPESSFQDQEDCVANSLFQLSDHVPRLDNKSVEPTKVACPFYIRTPRTMIIRPSAYRRFFDSYIDRQNWIVKSNRL